jgi:hypothetical protein
MMMKHTFSGEIVSVTSFGSTGVSSFFDFLLIRITWSMKGGGIVLCWRNPDTQFVASDACPAIWVLAARQFARPSPAQRRPGDVALAKDLDSDQSAARDYTVDCDTVVRRQDWRSTVVKRLRARIR